MQKIDKIFIIIVSLYQMCQCVCCDCWWMNRCGICCAGVSWNFLVCGLWLCKPQEMKNQDICTIGCSGWGGSCFFCSDVCCAPDYVINYSAYMASKGKDVTPLMHGQQY